jgi:hypothetical protein
MTTQGVFTKLLKKHGRHLPEKEEKQAFVSRFHELFSPGGKAELVTFR